MNIAAPQSNIHFVNPNVNLATGYGNLFITTNTAFAADIGGSISLGGYYDALSNIYHWAAIKGSKENATSANLAGYLSFFTVPASTGTATERVRIDSVGNVRFSSTSSFYWLNTSTRLGIRNSSPTSTIHNGGSEAYSYLSINSNTTLDETHCVILATASCTVTLPDATACAGRIYYLKLTGGSSTLTISTTSSQQIDGSATSRTITTQYKGFQVISNGSGWSILSEYDGTF